MGEEKVIQDTPQPRTRQSLASDLTELGLAEGMTVIVHSSLKSLGWVSGGPVAVVQALMDVVTPSGTIIMPTQSPNYSDPEGWEAPPVPESWRQTIRDSMPAYDPQITPTVGMGAIVEAFRTFPEVIRSSHPAHSFAAWGKGAEGMMKDHGLNNSLGEQSPLARIYEGNGFVLLLGVGYDSNTSFHLSEYRSNTRKTVKAGAPVIENGNRKWKEYHDIDLYEEIFPHIGRDFEEQSKVKIGKVGSAVAKLFLQREAVDFAEDWLFKKQKKEI